ncbi:hypothetical protein ACNKHR_07060 [Shigella flexneri]
MIFTERASKMPSSYLYY